MRILITGGAGFIGSALAAHYVSEGHVVTIADRFTYAGKGKNLWETCPGCGCSWGTWRRAI